MNRKRKICKTEIDEERDFIHKSPIYLAGCHDLIGPVSSSKITDLTLKILKYSSSRLKSDDFNQLIDSLKSLDSLPLPNTPPLPPQPPTLSDNQSTEDENESLLSLDEILDESGEDDPDIPDDSVKKEKIDDDSSLMSFDSEDQISKIKAESIGLRIAHACRLNPEIMGLLCSVLPPCIAETAPLRDSNSSLRAVREFFLCCLACGSDPSHFLISSLTARPLPETSILKRAKLANRPYLRTLLTNLQSDEPPSGDLIDEIEEINFDDWLEDPSCSRNQSTTVQFH